MLKKNILHYAVIDCENHRKLDKKTIKSHMSGFKLMENAGKAVFNLIKKKFNKNKKIKILCGPGNNGGDGFVLAKLLKKYGFQNVQIYTFFSEKRLKGDAKIAVNNININFRNLRNIKIINTDIIIDAMFGSGLKKRISGNLKKVIKEINLKKPYCISIDIPSGINGDTGQIEGAAIKANHTVTFTKKKPGHLLSPGSEHAGNVIVEDIGINLKKLLYKPNIFENHPSNWLNKFPWPNQKSHKYTRGFTLIICGEKMTGASRLAARAAARIGCGLLCLGVPKRSFNIYATENPIALIETIDQRTDLTRILKDKRINTVLIGPGFGISQKKLNLILDSVSNKNRITVLDADALKNNFKKVIKNNKTEMVITPHEGEFKKIVNELNLSKNKNFDKLSLVKIFVKKTNINLVLKGNKTIICSTDGKISINTNSSPFLATGGTGDVLSGMITGLISQGLNIFDACCAAVWIHGEIGKILGPGLIAEDIPENVPKVLKKLKNYRHN